MEHRKQCATCVQASGGSHGTLAEGEGEEHMDTEKWQHSILVKKKKKKSEGRVNSVLPILTCGVH